MKIKWLKDEVTCDELSQLLGIKVVSMTRPFVEVGKRLDSRNGKTIETPIMKEGVELEFEGTPTAEQLRKIDATFSGEFKREGQKPLAEEIDELKQRLTAVEKK